MHHKQVTGGIGYYKSEASWLLTKCKGRFVSYIFHKQHLIVIYLYIVENYVAGYI